ncbi:MAG: class I SAM-dependent methyltransferase [Candidatus Nitrospinota bacterium M3_3B_026]
MTRNLFSDTATKQTETGGRRRLARSEYKDSAAIRLAREALKTAFKGYNGPTAVRLWNGETVVGDRAAPCAIALKHPGALRSLVLRRDILELAELCLDGLIDIEGDLEKVFDFVEGLEGLRPGAKDKALILWKASRLPSLDKRGRDGVHGRKRNDRRAISSHYDVSNDFYRLWLDPELVYSCAYFRDEGQSLAEAQRDKLDHILKKLRIKPGQTLLDIGCGWGALIRMAARRYGARAHGITLSEEQYRYAAGKIREEGLSGVARVDLMDYRDLPEDASYDRIVSVGMFEHIGLNSFPDYFGTIHRALKPGGLFLNHGITNDSGWTPNPMREFLNRYVFPDGELTRISAVTRAMEEAGFEILDVESLRRHYAMTLRRWIRALEANADEAKRLVGERAYRVWRLYMAGSAHYFQKGSVMVYQALACHKGRAEAAPLRRDDLYRQ